MELPEAIVNTMLAHVEKFPDTTHAAVIYDGLGGYEITYVTSKERAERLTAGMVNTEVVEFTDEEVLCLTTKLVNLAQKKWES